MVCDDASDDPVTREYLYTDHEISTVHSWPKVRHWETAGLGFLPDNPCLNGIKDRVQVTRISHGPVGVVNASCFAIRDMFERSPSADGVILLQDDLVFKAHWYDRLLDAVRFQCRDPKPIGLIAGMTLNRLRNRPELVRGTNSVRFATGQCYFISRQFFEHARPWFCRTDHGPMGFDFEICALAQNGGFDVQLLAPYVCQHIGVASKVRPERRFFQSERSPGRFGFAVGPPFAFAESVRSFFSDERIVIDSESSNDNWYPSPEPIALPCFIQPGTTYCTFRSVLGNGGAYEHACQRDGCGNVFVTAAPRHRAVCRVQLQHQMVIPAADDERA